MLWKNILIKWWIVNEESKFHIEKPIMSIANSISLLLWTGNHFNTRTINWTNALTSYYTKSRRFSVDLVGFGPVRVSHVEKPELDQISRTHGD